MKINSIQNINFRENNLTRNMKSENAILMLRDPNAAVRFKNNQEYAKKADSSDSNPIVALGYKLHRTFNMIKGQETSLENKSIDTVA